MSSGSSKSLHSELSVDVDEDGSEPSVTSEDERETKSASSAAAPAAAAAPVTAEEAPNGQTAAAAGSTSGSRESYLTKLNYLFRDARFFIIKSNNEENVTLAKSRGVEC